MTILRKPKTNPENLNKNFLFKQILRQADF